LVALALVAARDVVLREAARRAGLRLVLVAMVVFPRCRGSTPRIEV
jgi:hypothetical protein